MTSAPTGRPGTAPEAAPSNTARLSARLRARLIDRLGITSHHFAPIDVFLLTGCTAGATWLALTWWTHMRTPAALLVTGTLALMTFGHLRGRYPHTHTDHPTDDPPGERPDGAAGPTGPGEPTPPAPAT